MATLSTNYKFFYLFYSLPLPFGEGREAFYSNNLNESVSTFLLSS